MATITEKDGSWYLETNENHELMKFMFCPSCPLNKKGICPNVGSIEGKTIKLTPSDSDINELNENTQKISFQAMC